MRCLSGAETPSARSRRVTAGRDLSAVEAWRRWKTPQPTRPGQLDWHTEGVPDGQTVVSALGRSAVVCGVRGVRLFILQHGLNRGGDGLEVHEAGEDRFVADGIR